MQEADAAGDADARLLVDDLDLPSLQRREIVVDAINLEADVMEPFAALVEIAGDAGIRDDRLQQLDLAVAEGQQRRPDALLGDDLLLAYGKAERGAIEGHRHLRIAAGCAQMAA